MLSRCIPGWVGAAIEGTNQIDNSCGRAGSGGEENLAKHGDSGPRLWKHPWGIRTFEGKVNGVWSVRLCAIASLLERWLTLTLFSEMLSAPSMHLKETERSRRPILWKPGIDSREPGPSFFQVNEQYFLSLFGSQPQFHSFTFDSMHLQYRYSGI